MSHRLPKKQIFMYAWELFQSRFWFFVGATAGFVLVGGVIMHAQKIVEHTNTLAFIAFAIAGALYKMAVWFGFMNISLKALSQKPYSLRDFFSPLDFFPDYLARGIIYQIVVLAGFVLLIIPGIILSLKYLFYGFVFLDKKSSIKDCFTMSNTLTKGFRFQLLIILLILGCINILGAITIVGLCVTIPFSVLVLGETYQNLSHQPKQVA